MNASLSKAPKRNAQRTQESILNAAQAEFCNHGYTGARMERIARRSRSNIRMIYHYFGNKEKLYVTCLDRIYVRVRGLEMDLHLKDLDPVWAITNKHISIFISKILNITLLIVL